MNGPETTELACSHAEQSFAETVVSPRKSKSKHVRTKRSSTYNVTCNEQRKEIIESVMDRKLSIRKVAIEKSFLIGCSSMWG